MTRAIKNKIDAKFANMTKSERLEYLERINLKYAKSPQVLIQP